MEMRRGAPDTIRLSAGRQGRKVKTPMAQFLAEGAARRRILELAGRALGNGQKLRSVGIVSLQDRCFNRSVWIWLSREEAARLSPKGAGYIFVDGRGRRAALRIMDKEDIELKRIFGKAFRAARLEAGLTQDEVKELTGVAQSEISKIERLDPRTNPTLSTMGKLARAVGKPLADLLRPHKPNNSRH